MFDVWYYGRGQLPYGATFDHFQANDPIGERTFGDFALEIITKIMVVFT